MSNKFRSLKRTTYTQSTDFSLTDAKNWLKMDDISADDALITSLIETAVSKAEEYTGLIFGQATITAIYDDIYSYNTTLLYSPIVSIQEVRGIDEDLTSNVLDSGDYYTVTGNNGSLNLKSGKSLPDSDRCTARFEIDYTVGLANGEIPQDIINGVYIFVNDMYENRKSVSESSLSKTPVDSIMLWSTHRVNLI